MKRKPGMYYTPKNIVLTPASGSGAFLKDAAELLLGNPPYVGAAGFCLHCSRRTVVNVIGVGSFCATHYLEYVEQNNAPITPELKEHYRQLSIGER